MSEGLLERETVRPGGDIPRKGKRTLGKRAKRTVRVGKRGTRNRERRKGMRKRETRENQFYKGGDPMDEKTARKSTNRELVPPWYFLRITVRGAKR